MTSPAAAHPTKAPPGGKARRVSRGTKPLIHSWTEPLTRDWAEMWSSYKGTLTDIHKQQSLPQDVLAGLTVAAVALPLNLALAVASGLPPAAGLVAGAIGGFIAAFIGGAPLQVTGPAAALSSIVMGIALGFGPEGVAMTALIVGGFQLILAFTRAGHLMARVPESVLAGFTTGVGIKLLDQQIPELLGFDYRVSELAAMIHRPDWLKEVEWLAVVCGLFVALLVVGTARFKRFPAAIVGVGVVTFIANYVGWDVTRVGEVPSTFPPFSFPTIADGRFGELFLAALPLAFLASAESLLASRAVDRMQGDNIIRPAQPSLELFGQGLANLTVGFFSGMPVSGVVVRSGVNVQSGARTKVASILHAVFLGAAVLLMSGLIAKVPLAALAGLLCVIGMRLIDVGLLIELFRHEKVEAIAFLVTAAGTISGHLMAGLAGGLLIHAFNYFVIHRKDRKQAAEKPVLANGVRAVLHKEHALARQVQRDVTGSAAEWMAHVRSNPVIPSTSFVHHQAAVIGQVVLGENVHIAAGSSVRADEGTPFFIGPNTNLQDGVVIHALKQRHVEVAGEKWAVFIGRNVSVAHDALVHGPCYVGDDTFIGFKAVVHDSVVGRNCFVGIGSIVVGVEVPDGRFVPHGAIIDTQDKADALAPASDAQHHFNEDVVDVNRGLAAAYRRLLDAGHPAPKLNSNAGDPSSWDERWARPSNDRF
ncbi:MAG: SulP family inorganic anion transporter [Archangium sp.]|nr:SulP family inorganic anion transporter [Archangium sp.]MDP3570169.1 SulP family inorganic anion transporter [Archangium sp.]